MDKMTIWQWLTLILGVCTLVSFVINIIQWITRRELRKVFEATLEELYRIGARAAKWSDELRSQTSSLTNEGGELPRSATRRITIQTGRLQGMAQAIMACILGCASRYLKVAMPKYRDIMRDFEEESGQSGEDE